MILMVAGLILWNPGRCLIERVYGVGRGQNMLGSVSPDLRRILVADVGFPMVYEVAFDSGEMIREFLPHERNVSQIEFSSDGRFF